MSHHFQVFILQWTRQCDAKLLLLSRMANAWVLSNVMMVDANNDTFEDVTSFIPIQSLVSSNDGTIPKDNMNSLLADYFSDWYSLHTLADNKQSFSVNQIEGWNHARKLQQRLVWPSTTTYKSDIVKNIIINCKLTVDDMDRGEIIYGTPVPILKVKMNNIRIPSNTIVNLNIWSTWLPPYFGSSSSTSSHLRYLCRVSLYQ